MFGGGNICGVLLCGRRAFGSSQASGPGSDCYLFTPLVIAPMYMSPNTVFRCQA